VLLVTIDTLRADRLSGGEYPRDTTPFLAGLAEEGVRFSHAYASSSWTVPSLVSLLTSLDPTTHGVEHGHLAEGGIQHQEVIPTQVQLWAELLKAAGYRTFGLTANGHLQGRFGFARGFDRYTCVGFESSERIEELTADWRDEIRAARPRFVWIHLLDPHAPYLARAPWIRRYAPRLGRMAAPLSAVAVPEDYKALGVTAGSLAFAFVKALYDSEVAHTDAAIRRLFDALEVSPRDLVIVAADHGEEFLDHGRFGHSFTLFEEVIRVPLLLRLPGGEAGGQAVDAPVSLVDLLPTVLDVLELPVPAQLQGTSLLPLMRGRRSAPAAIVASLARFPALQSRSIRSGRWKYVHRYAEPREHMLFDLEADPQERNNLIDSRPTKARELARALTGFVAERERARLEPARIGLSAEESEELRNLGYVE
jgi:arylsulfatase A-like enzyme